MSTLIASILLCLLQITPEWQNAKVLLEKSFCQDIIIASKEYVHQEVDPGLIEPVRSNIYKQEAGHYQLESVKNISYFIESDGKFTPLVSSLYPEETVLTLCTVPTARNYTLRIHQNRYGFETSDYDLPLNTVIEGCIVQGCTPYVGIESIDGNTIRLSLFMVNEVKGFNHLFQISLDKKILKRDKGVISAILNAYIPTGNVKTMYDE